MSTLDNDNYDGEVGTFGPRDTEEFVKSWRESDKRSNPDAFNAFLCARLPFLFGTAQGAHIVFRLAHELISSMNVPPTSSAEEKETFGGSEFETTLRLLQARKGYLMDARKNELYAKLRQCGNFEEFEAVMTDASRFKQQCDDLRKVYKAVVSRAKSYRDYLDKYNALVEKMDNFNSAKAKYKDEPLLIKFLRSELYQAFSKRKLSVFKSISAEEYIKELHVQFKQFYFASTEDILRECERTEWKNCDIAVGKLQTTPDELNNDLTRFQTELENVADEMVKQVVEGKMKEEVAHIERYTQLVEPHEPRQKNNSRMIHFSVQDNGFRRVVESFVLSEYATLSLERLDAYLQWKYPPQTQSGEISLKTLKEDKRVSQSAKAVLITGECRWGSFKIKTTDPNIYFTQNAFDSLFGGNR